MYSIVGPRIIVICYHGKERSNLLVDVDLVHYRSALWSSGFYIMLCIGLYDFMFLLRTKHRPDWNMTDIVHVVYAMRRRINTGYTGDSIYDFFCRKTNTVK